jgi:SAM-dependent methyltransferase
VVPLVRCPLCGAREHRVIDPASAPTSTSASDGAPARASAVTQALGIVRCLECGLVRATGHFDAAYLDGAYYGARARREDPEEHALAVERKRRDLRLYDRLADGHLRRPPPTGAALDVGCGTGALLDVLATWGWDTLGIERSPAAAAVARERHRVEAVDVERTEGLGERFGVITLIHVLEHLTRPVEALRWIGGHLAPGGRAVIEVPNWDDLGRPLWGRAYRPLELGDHVTFWERRTLAEAIARADLRLLDMWSAPRGASLVLPQVLTALDLSRRWWGSVRGESPTDASVAAPRGSGRGLGAVARGAVLRALDELDEPLERLAGPGSPLGANLVAVVDGG